MALAVAADRAHPRHRIEVAQHRLAVGRLGVRGARFGAGDVLRRGSLSDERRRLGVERRQCAAGKRSRQRNDQNRQRSCDTSVFTHERIVRPPAFQVKRYPPTRQAVTRDPSIGSEAYPSEETGRDRQQVDAYYPAHSVTARGRRTGIDCGRRRHECLTRTEARSAGAADVASSFSSAASRASRSRPGSRTRRFRTPEGWFTSVTRTTTATCG